MDADLDTLCIAVYCTADDLLPEPPGNARRMVTDAEVVTLCVAQAIMGIPSDRRFLKVARKRLGHLFPRLPAQSGYFKRRRRLADTIEWLMGVFASQSPGYHDDLLLIDSTPVECARSRETVKRSAARRRCRLRLLRVATPATSGASGCTRSSPPTAPHERSRSPRPNATSARSDSNCSPAATATAAKHCSATRATPAASSPKPSATSTPRSCGPAAKTNPDTDPTSRRSGNGSSRSSGPAKTCSPSNATAPAPSHGLKERILQRFLSLAACIALNHQLGRPSRALVDYVA